MTSSVCKGSAFFNAEQGLVFPKKRNGEWLHQDGLSGSGWVEANSWQATWSLSHELPKFVKMMGGADKFCEKLNFAFEQAKDLDFVYAYSGGYEVMLISPDVLMHTSLPMVENLG